jgi:Spy/CpxP family protein refolding chaperone
MAVFSCEIDHADEKEKDMKQIRSFTIVVALLLATGTFAQSGQGPDDSKQQGSGQKVGQGNGSGVGHGLPTVEEQLKVLTGKLNLTTDQQAKITPIMQELHDATLKLMQDEKLSHEERLDRVRPLRYNADKRIREILNDDQKKKLDQYEQGPHHEMHGNLEGKTPPPTRPPQ